MHGFVAPSATTLASNLDDVLGAGPYAYLRPPDRHCADRQARRTCDSRDPPQPIASASAPAHNRRARSSIVAVSSRHFWRTSFSASTANVDHVREVISSLNRPRSIDLFKRRP